MKNNSPFNFAFIGLLTTSALFFASPAHALTPPIQTSYVMVLDITQNSARVQTVFGNDFQQYYTNPSHFEYYADPCAVGMNCATMRFAMPAMIRTTSNTTHVADLYNLEPNTRYVIHPVFETPIFCITTPCPPLAVSGPSTTFVTMYAQVPAGTDLFSTNLSYGMWNNPDVSLLQAILKELGFYSGSVTGNFGVRTWLAVRNYQASVGLSRVGRAGPLTEQALIRSISTLPADVSASLQRVTQ